MEEEKQPEPVSRRLVNLLLGMGLVGTLSGFMGAALAYLWPRRGEAAGSALLQGPQRPLHPEDIRENQGLVGRSFLGKILVVRRNDTLVGLQATCTHLGCTVAWNPEHQQVECPCHGARYDLQGALLRGPARQPLAQVELVVVEGGIQVLPPEEG